MVLLEAGLRDESYCVRETCAVTRRGRDLQGKARGPILEVVQGAYEEEDGREVEVQATLETRRRGQIRKTTPLATERRAQYQSPSAEADNVAPKSGWVALRDIQRIVQVRCGACHRASDSRTRMPSWRDHAAIRALSSSLLEIGAPMFVGIPGHPENLNVGT